MKKSKFTEEQIAFALSQAESGCRRKSSKKAVKPASKRELANFLIGAYRVSIRRATAVIQLRQAKYF